MVDSLKNRSCEERLRKTGRCVKGSKISLYKCLKGHP